MKLPQPHVVPCAAPNLSQGLGGAPYTMLLQSLPGHPLGQRSLLAQNPFQVVIIHGQRVRIHSGAGVRELAGDPWTILASLMEPYRQQPDSRHPCPGGVLGYLGYDLARRAGPLAAAPDDLGLPDAVLGFYAQVRCWEPGDPGALLGQMAASPGSAIIEAALDLPALPPVLRSASLSQPEYLDRVRQVLEYIAAGDIYQANLTIQMRAAAQSDPWTIYQRLCARTAAPFSAYLGLPGVTVLSASPERFLRCSPTGAVETRPIKGTRPRGATPQADQALAAALQSNEKERAENLMITDLLRNDLGRVCQIGSVHVPALWQVETFPTVHHLVSTIAGQLAPDQSVWELLRACWPGGSITGAPKRRALELIAELEPVARGVYCGAIGYWSFDGGMDTSIVIRTLVLRDAIAGWGVGCGIVADSDPEAEYAEALLKGAALEAALKP